MRFLTNILFAARAQCSVFTSRNVTTQLLRGAIAAGSLSWALLNDSSPAAFDLAAIGVAFLAMRGCPMCWLVGLIETIAAQVTR